MNLESYKSNTYSQYGEDGIIKEILDRLGIIGGLCLDIGAHNGVTNSNVLCLIERGFGAWLIECDEGRCKAMKKNMEDRGLSDRVNITKSRVTPALAPIIAPRVKGKCMVLSLDIDGGEPAIWKGLGSTAIVAVVEWNHKGNKQAEALDETAEGLGYTRVAKTNSNHVYVRNDWMPKLGE